MKLNKLKDEAYRIACEHGWHDEYHPDEHWLMLTVTEIAEAVQADRKNKHARKDDYNSLICYAQKENMLSGEYLERYLKEAFQNEIKDTVEDELADVSIRCLDLAGLKKYDLCESLEPTDAMLKRTKAMTFTEWAYKITDIAVDDFITTDTKITLILLNVIAEANVMGIDLEFHIREKMKYNRTREFKHGKNY